MRGAFITLEGGEGCGKSTQAALLAGRLIGEGLVAPVYREPGGTVLGDRLRSVLLDPAMVGHVEPLAELFMYEAARAQLVGSLIAEVEQGRVVVCDRFYDSTTAYQGYGRGLDTDVIARLNEVAAHGCTPDLTIVFDIDPRVGLMRATELEIDRLEAESLDFHTRVREGFLAIAAAEPERVKVVAADGPVPEVAAEVWGLVSERLRDLGVL